MEKGKFLMYMPSVPVSDKHGKTKPHRKIPCNDKAESQGAPKTVGYIFYFPVFVCFFIVIQLLIILKLKNVFLLC